MSSNGKERKRESDSDDDKPLRLQKNKKTAPAKPVEPSGEDSDDAPLSNKLLACAQIVKGKTFDEMVAENLALEGIRNKTIDGRERPVPKPPLTKKQVDEESRRRNDLVREKMLGENAGRNKMSKRERFQNCHRAMSARDRKQDEEDRSDSEEGSSDDEDYGAVSDDLELMRNDAPKTIHTTPSSVTRARNWTVKFNPRYGGADTLAKDHIVPGFGLRIKFKLLGGLGGGYIECYVTWHAAAYRTADRNASGSSYQDGSRHPVQTQFVGWSLHNSATFLEEFRLLLEKETTKSVGAETAFQCLKKNMDGHGLCGKEIVIYMDAEKNLIHDKFLDVEFMGEFDKEVETVVEEEEGQEKKKKKTARDFDSDDLQDGDFSQAESSDSASQEDSENSDSDSGKSADDRSDVSEESQGDANPNEDGQEETNEETIPEGELQGYQQDMASSDSDEASDEESCAAQSESDGSE